MQNILKNDSQNTLEKLKLEFDSSDYGCQITDEVTGREITYDMVIDEITKRSRDNETINKGD